MNKTKSLVIKAQFVLLIVMGFYFSGCSDSVTSSGITQSSYSRAAKTESQFALNSELKALPGAVVVDMLEDIGSPVSSNDTGPMGEDIIPYAYTETAEHQFEIGDSTFLKIKLVSDSSGAVLFELNPNQRITVIIPAGNYKMHLISLLISSGADTTKQTVFIQPNKKRAYTGSGSLTFNDDDLTTLIETNKCHKCNLDSMSLPGSDLRNLQVDSSSFTGANFTRTRFFGSVFNNCMFLRTNFISARFDTVSFFGSSFQNAKLISAGGPKIKIKKTQFINSEWVWADLRNAEVTECTFKNSRIDVASATGSYFYKTIFDESNGNNADFTEAVVKDCKFNNSTYYQIIVRSAIFCGSTSHHTEFDLSVANLLTRCWPMPVVF